MRYHKSNPIPMRSCNLWLAVTCMTCRELDSTCIIVLWSTNLKSLRSHEFLEHLHHIIVCQDHNLILQPWSLLFQWDNVATFLLQWKIERQLPHHFQDIKPLSVEYIPSTQILKRYFKHHNALYAHSFLTTQCSYPLIKIVHWESIVCQQVYSTHLFMQFPSCLLQQPSPVKLAKAALWSSWHLHGFVEEAISLSGIIAKTWYPFSS